MALKHKEYLYSQDEVQYDPNGGASTPRDQACSTCRWFEAVEEGGGSSCHLVMSYPAPIVSNAWCNKWEAIPAQEPAPLEVVIVDAPTEIPSGDPEMEMQMSDDGKQMTVRGKGLIERFKNWVKPQSEPAIIGLKINGNNFLATYSGNFEDLEKEYFPQKACEDYVQRVELGIIDPPVLAVWHYMNPDTKQGAVVGDVATVGLIGNLMVAAGKFRSDERSQKARDYYEKHASETRLSHGFFYDAKYKQGNAYWRFNTFEITLLPKGKEAFPFTAFDMKEYAQDTTMALSDQQRQYFESIWGKEETDKIIAEREGVSKALQDMGVRYKDFTPATETTKEKAAPSDAHYKTLFGDVIEDQGKVVEQLKAMDVRFDRQDKELAQLKADNLRMQQALALKPTPASKSDDTVVSEKDKEFDAAQGQLRDKSQAVNPFGAMFPDLIKK